MKATTGNRCEQHAREYEERRGTRQSRGYDAAYDDARRKAEPKVAAGKAICWRCGERIEPGSEWDLGHGDDGRIRGPEHRRTCNLRAAGLKAAGRDWTPAGRREAPAAAAPAPLSEDLRRSRLDARQRADRALERRTARLARREEDDHGE